MIICKALAYATAAIDRLPPKFKEASDQRDMIKLLDVISDGDDRYRIQARAHLMRRGIAVEDGRLMVAPSKPGTVVPMEPHK